MPHTHGSLPLLQPEGAASWAYAQAAGTREPLFLLLVVRQVFKGVPLLLPKTQKVPGLSPWGALTSHLPSACHLVTLGSRGGSCRSLACPLQGDLLLRSISLSGARCPSAPRPLQGQGIQQREPCQMGCPQQLPWWPPSTAGPRGPWGRNPDGIWRRRTLVR